MNCRVTLEYLTKICHEYGLLMYKLVGANELKNLCFIFYFNFMNRWLLKKGFTVAGRFDLNI